MITNNQRKYFLLLLFFVTVSIGFAQDIPPPNPPPPGFGDQVPIDGGVFLLGILALVYGFFKKK